VQQILEIVLQNNFLLEQEQALVQTLTPEQLKNWKHWGARLSRKKAWCAMLSKQYRDGKKPISKKAARANDRNWTRFINWYMSWEVEDIARLEPLCLDLRSRPRLVKIGAGVGLGVDYLKDATKILNLEVYDWKASALKYVEKALRSVIREYGLDEEKLLRIGEASQVCQELDTSVRMLELVRVDEHMSDEDAATMFQGAGHILQDPRNRVIVTGARSGEVNDVVGVETCHHRDKNFPLEHLQIGADRELYVYRRRTFRDIEKEFTFDTIRARP